MSNGVKTSQGVETLACCLSGVLVCATIGLIVGRFLTNSWEDVPVIIGVLGGGLFGLVAGRRIAACETIVGGMAFGAFLPIGLILLGALRSGRMPDPGELLKEPRALVVIGGILGGGAVIGGLLVAVRRLLVRLLAGKQAA
jgi:hypothetical protein